MLPRHLLSLILILLFLAPPGADARPRERLELRPVSLDLPAAPAAILPADLDGDGLQDLVVAVVYTEWDQIGIEESAVMDDVEGLVEVLTIVPALTDRREVRFFRGNSAGGFEDTATLPIDRSVLSLLAGPPGMPIIAVTDDGLAALRWQQDAGLTLEHFAADRPVLAGSGTFVSSLDLTHDLDGDGLEDLLFPATDGAAVYLADGTGLRREPAARLTLPSDRTSRSGRVRHVPLPEVHDVDGDGLPDLVLPHHELGWDLFYVVRGAGGGRFSEAIGPLDHGQPGEEPPAEEDDLPALRGGSGQTQGSGGGDWDDWDEGDEGDEGRQDEETADPPHIVFFGDIDGDGVAEYVTEENLADDDAGWRKELKEVKNPPFLIRFHRTRADLSMETEAYQELEVVGYAFDTDDDEDMRIPGGFQDLNGDGRLDLIAVTLDFSILQAVRVLTVHSISVGLDFHVWCQNSEGRFRPVTGLDLGGKFRLDLDNLRLGRLSQFAGDFDGDGRADFVQMGRGRTVTIHRGRGDCSYPAAPDLSINLREAPRDLGLVQVRDLDGDDLTDLLVIQPQRVEEPGVTPPVRLDLYLSGSRP